MTSRRLVMRHKPGGRLEPIASDAISPTEMRRLLDAARAGVRDALWGSEVGRLHMAGKLTALQLSTAKRWAQITASYSLATDSPRAPCTTSFERGSLGHPPDPESPAGKKLAQAHAKATLNYIQGRSALRRAGPIIERVVEEVVIHDRALAGFAELQQLRQGLQTLSVVWAANRRKR